MLLLLQVILAAWNGMCSLSNISTINSPVYVSIFYNGGPGYCCRYCDSLRAGRSGDRIPVGGEIYRPRLDRPWSPPSLLYNWYRVSFPGVKRPGRGVTHPPPSSAEVKERVELYLYSLYGPSWPVLGRTLPHLLRFNFYCYKRHYSNPLSFI
jgi:hypothetical protein